MQAVRSRSARLCAAIVTVALLSGCDDSTGPAAAEWRRYVLAEVDGGPLPAAVVEEEPDTVHILTDTISLDDAGWASVRLRVRRVSGATAPETLSTTGSVPYTVTGNAIAIGNAVVCVVAPCPGPLQGEISDTELLLSQPGATPERVYRFARVPPGI